MDIPSGFTRQGDCHKICKLHKSLYGLKETPRQWNVKLTEALVQMGFKQSHYDYSLFTEHANAYDDTVVVLVYVDSAIKGAL